MYLSDTSFVGTFCMSGWHKKMKKFSFLHVIKQLVGVGIEVVSWRTATRLLYVLARVWINFLSWSFSVRFAVNNRKEKYVHTHTHTHTDTHAYIYTYIHTYQPHTYMCDTCIMWGMKTKTCLLCLCTFDLVNTLADTCWIVQLNERVYTSDAVTVHPKCGVPGGDFVQKGPEDSDSFSWSRTWTAENLRQMYTICGSACLSHVVVADWLCMFQMVRLWITELWRLGVAHVANPENIAHVENVVHEDRR